MMSIHACLSDLFGFTSDAIVHISVHCQQYFMSDVMLEIMDEKSWVP